MKGRSSWQAMTPCPRGRTGANDGAIAGIAGAPVSAGLGPAFAIRNAGRCCCRVPGRRIAALARTDRSALLRALDQTRRRSRRRRSNGSPKFVRSTALRSSPPGLKRPAASQLRDLHASPGLRQLLCPGHGETHAGEQAALTGGQKYLNRKNRDASAKNECARALDHTLRGAQLRQRHGRHRLRGRRGLITSKTA